VCKKKINNNRSHPDRPDEYHREHKFLLRSKTNLGGGATETVVFT